MKNMKNLTLIILSGMLLLSTSCNKYLDVNTDPNNATSASVELILPQALAYTAGAVNSLNTMGQQIGGYASNAGGYGGFGTSITYNYTSSEWSGIFSSSYDILNDYQTIINKTRNLPNYNYFHGVAQIMKAMHYQHLVDAYNDVPYLDALKGSEVLNPTYTTGPVIYKNIADSLDAAIAKINAGVANVNVVELGVSDVMFGGNVVNWKKLANTIKLRILVRGRGKVTFSNSTFSSDGFLTSDALVNPGYTRDNGRQNPKWSSWGWSYTGTSGNKAWMPTFFAHGFYTGQKLVDSSRGKALFYNYPSVTSCNQLGNESLGVASSPDGSFWFPAPAGPLRVGTSAGNSIGVLKGPDAGLPLITASESYFIQAEAALYGIISSITAQAAFDNGINHSFNYLYSLPNKSVVGNPSALAATYKVDNASSHLVNFNLALTTEQKLEAIITQKWIALNMVNCDQSWNDYRRTLYPKLNNAAGATKYETFASLKSESTRPDKLPTRILYPSSEGTYNPTNVPKGLSPFTSLIFWAK